MKMKIATIMCAVLASCLAFAAAEKPAIEGAELGKWTMDVTAAKALAKTTGKPLFLNFTGSDWCGWCKMMDKKIFSQPDWQAYAKENLVLVWVDFPKNKALVPEAFRERNRALSEQYGVEGYPTYVILASDGETVLGQLGAEQDVTPAEYAGMVADVLFEQSVDQWLTAEDQAAMKAANAQIETLKTEITAWQQQMMREGMAFQERLETAQKTREALIQKAKAAAKQ